MQEPFPESVVILGAAGGGRMVHWMIRETHPGTRVIFVDDGMEEDSLVIAGEEFPVLHKWEFDCVQKPGTDDFRQFMVSCTFPWVKKALVTKALAAGLLPAPTVVHPSATLMGRPTISLGRSGIVLPSASILNDTVIGDYVFVSMGAQIAHDCIVEDFASINSGVVLLGYAHVKTGVALGAGTMVRDHLTIAPWVKTGMQACVVRDVLEEGITLVGVPARPLVKTPPVEH
jgi:sugar O-acyltransferase (sialic acid O-acetyltransferase NeuD family)